MSGEAFLGLASLVSLGLLSLALLLCVARIVLGPTLPDRAAALDLLARTGVGYVAAVAILTGSMLYLDIAISLALAGLLATIAFALALVRRRAGGTSGEGGR